jgi:hypothetical protein
LEERERESVERERGNYHTIYYGNFIRKRVFVWLGEKKRKEETLSE